MKTFSHGFPVLAKNSVPTEAVSERAKNSKSVAESITHHNWRPINGSIAVNSWHRLGAVHDYGR